MHLVHAELGLHTTCEPLRVLGAVLRVLSLHLGSVVPLPSALTYHPLNQLVTAHLTFSVQLRCHLLSLDFSYHPMIPSIWIIFSSEPPFYLAVYPSGTSLF